MRVTCMVSRAFTLVELLVVIAIVGVLLSFLVPVLGRARMEAARILCQSNLRQVGMGNEIYQMDHNRWILAIYDNSFMAPSVTLNGLAAPYPKYWGDIWPEAIRWCPNVRQDPEVLNPSAMTWLPRLDYNQYHAYGYFMPMLETNISRRMFGRTSYRYSSNQFYPDYIRLTEGRPASVTRADLKSGDDEIYGGKKYDPIDTVPMASDMIFSISSGKRNVTAHPTQSGPVKTTQFREPMGANSLWRDGTVTWGKWLGTGADVRSIQTGAGGGEEWASLAGSYFYRARPSKLIF